MIRWCVAITVLFSMAGCATTHATYAPDGRKAYTLNCSGTSRGWEKCVAAAGALCGPAGYDVLDRTYDGMSVGGGRERVERQRFQGRRSSAIDAGRLQGGERPVSAP